MKLSAFATVVSLTLGSTRALDIRDTPAWTAAGPGDARGPCPALNALANHGLLPHNGKNITIPMLIQSFSTGLNVGSDIAVTLGEAAALLVNPNNKILSPSFSLDQLDLHNAIEHDFSLSRGDNYFGDNHSFNQTIFNDVLKYVPDGGSFNVQSAAAARHNRYEIELKRDPQITDTFKTQLLSSAETALYLSVMGDPITAVAPKNYVQMLFEQEKLPYELGWKAPSTTTNLATFTVVLTRVAAAMNVTVAPSSALTEIKRIIHPAGGPKRHF